MKKEIVDVFEARYKLGGQVQYINAAYDIGNFYEVSSKFNSLSKDIALVEYYIRTRAAEVDEETKEKKDPEYNEDKYRAECDEKR